MPSMPGKLAKVGPSVTVMVEVGRSLWTNGRDRVNENLNTSERAEFGQLLRRSKGRRSKLDFHDRERLAFLIRKAATGDGYTSWARVLQSLAGLLPPRILSDAFTKLTSRRRAPSQ